MLERIRRLPAGVPLYSNAPDAIRFHTGRPARRLPQRWDPVNKRASDDLRGQLLAMRRDLEQHGGLVVWFDDLDWRAYMLTRKDLALMPLKTVETFRDGSLYENR